jgi:hypothetical protein
MKDLVRFEAVPRKGRTLPGWWVRVFRWGYIGTIQWIPNSKEFRFLPFETPQFGWSEGVLTEIVEKIRQARMRRRGFGLR